MPQKVSRTWGTRFDSFISSDTSPPHSAHPETTETLDSPNTSSAQQTREENSDIKDQRMPHDASIFVGSLPPNLEQPELTRLLSEHLAEHKGIIVYIKVIRDSKGGVCAFIQCLSASHATELIKALNMAGKPFLGRYLRYEVARAFRTLLVSYRTPMQKGVELDLPTAMKMWRERDNKYLSILYNQDAVASGSTQDYRGIGLYLSPVLCDEETICKIAQTFGPVEQFCPYVTVGTNSSKDSSTNQDSVHESNLYPPPHDAPRTSSMDPRCWEIKWGHRDDAVSALNTLSRVPHLTVTWAHQTGHAPSEGHHSFRPSSLLHTSGPVPMGLQAASQSSPKQTTGHPGFEHSPGSRSIRNIIFPLSQHSALSSDQSENGDAAGGNPEDDVFSSNAATCAADDGLLENQRSPAKVVSDPNSPSPLSVRYPLRSRSPNLTEHDFPPLGLMIGGQKMSVACWGDRKQGKSSDEHGGLPRITSTSPLATPRVSNVEMLPLKVISELSQTDFEEDGQYLSMPPTPDFGRSPNTPRTASSAMFPPTPSNCIFDYGVASVREHADDGVESRHEYEENKGRDPDPTTLFVGGLEIDGPNAWNETKVREFFSKYGGIEDVKVVYPANGRCCFAFVKFDNMDAPARAVHHEHNRLHGGRPIRVQLRDRNPPRGLTWRYGRGRGRYSNYGTPRHYSNVSGIISQEGSLEKEPTPNLSPRAFNSVHSGEYEKAEPAISFPSLLQQPDGSYSDTDSMPDDAAELSHPNGSHLQTPDPNFVDYPHSPGTVQHEGADSDSVAPLTPLSSAYNSSVSASIPSVQYPVPHGFGYYPPWIQSFGQQFPYSMPYVQGAPVYPTQTQQMAHTFASPGGSESSGPTAGFQPPWVTGSAMYPPYLPYSNSTQSPTVARPPQQGSSHAPLIPTGFIQGEQGLIPVYQPEALDNYMASPSPNPAQTQPQSPTAWRQYPATPTFPFIPVPPMAGHPGSFGWIPQPNGLAITGGPPHSTSANRGNARMGPMGNHNAPGRRRHGGTRGHPRSAGGSHHDAGHPNPNHATHGPGQQGVYASQQGPAGTSWSHWTAGR